MRLRSIKNQQQKIRKNELTINQPQEHKGQWSHVFNNSNPIWIEIGMGLGGYLSQKARLYPDINFIGIEKYSKVIVRALRAFDEENFDNVRLLRFDAEELLDIFGEGEIARVILNFSDPWPKRRHEERRLTHPSFLAIYDKILSSKGKIHFKTDNDDFFNYSLEVIKKSNWIISFVTYDLHSKNVENVMTEYEIKFSSEGTRIKKLIATR